MKEIGEKLKEARENNGVSITEACEDLDFSTSELENIESGNVKERAEGYLKKIAEKERKLVESVLKELAYEGR